MRVYVHQYFKFYIGRSLYLCKGCESQNSDFMKGICIEILEPKHTSYLQVSLTNITNYLKYPLSPYERLWVDECISAGRLVSRDYTAVLEKNIAKSTEYVEPITTDNYEVY